MLNVKAIYETVESKLRALITVSAGAKGASNDSRAVSKDANHTALEFGALLWTQGITDPKAYRVLTQYSDWRNLPKAEKQRASERMSRVKAIWKTPEGAAMFRQNAERWVREGITEDERTELYALIRAEMTADRLHGMFTRMKYLQPEQAREFLRLMLAEYPEKKKVEKVA